MPTLQKHRLAVRRVRIHPNIRINRRVAQAAHNRAVHLLPHGRAVRNMVLPVDVQARVLSRHDLLVANGLRAVGVQVPLQADVEVFGQLFVVACRGQPAEGDGVKVASAFAGFG